jgi:two-component system sensor kinase FixL
MSSPFGLRILIVEDDPDTRANLCDLLALDGYQVSEASTAAAALDRDDWTEIDAVLLDWKLPDASAETLLPELRQRAPHASVIVSTGVGGLEEAVTAIRNGASDYITKPIDPDLLRAGLRRVARQRELLAAKARSETAFRNLVEAAGSLIVILGTDGHIVYMNPSAESATGRRFAEVRQTTCLDLCIPPEQHAALRDAITSCMAQARSIETEQPLLHRDGTRRWILWNIRPFDDYAGEPTLLAIGTDVTARRDTEARLRQAERLAAIGKAMTGLAHESRNALQRAQANLELLALYVEQQPEARQIVERLQATQADLYRLYEEVRQYAAPVNLQLQPEDVRSVLQEAWGALAPDRQKRDARLQLADSPCDTVCRVDRFQLLNAFRNILENALAAPDPVRITVTISATQWRSHPALQLTIRDNGPGIPPGQAEQIFDEFFTTKQRGTGLGLAIVRRIIEAHGGNVQANSNCQDGAEIVITLPISR